MKKIKILVLLISSVFCLSSCLHYKLDDLKLYGDANITSIQGVQYRYIGTNINPVNGEAFVEYVTMNESNVKIDNDSATITFEVSKPANFPASEESKLSQNCLVVYVQLSTAARCEPVEGAPALGVPGDWSKPNKYLVTAADGTTKVWTLSISKFTK